MKKKSDDVFQKENEGSLRLRPEAKSFRLTGLHWKDAPQLILGLVSSLVLLTGINLAYAAVFSKDLLIDEARLTFSTTRFKSSKRPYQLLKPCCRQCKKMIKTLFNGAGRSWQRMKKDKNIFLSVRLSG